MKRYGNNFLLTFLSTSITIQKQENKMLTIAIDPGASGGIAVWCPVNEKAIVMKMPETPRDIYDLFAGLLETGNTIRAVVEKVGMHRQGNNASASCKFARHCGHIEMALLALGIPFEEVTPQKWMKSLGVMPKDKKDRKNHIKDIAQRRYPDVKCTLWNSDALGILIHTIDKNK
jgi:hypothetical protein